MNGEAYNKRKRMERSLKGNKGGRNEPAAIFIIQTNILAFFSPILQSINHFSVLV